MAIAQEALRVNRDLAVAALRDDGEQSVRSLAAQRTARSDDRDTQWNPQMMSGVNARLRAVSLGLAKGDDDEA